MFTPNILDNKGKPPAKERNFRNTLIMLVGFKYLKIATWNTEEKIVLLLFVITVFMQISQLKRETNPRKAET